MSLTWDSGVYLLLIYPVIAASLSSASSPSALQPLSDYRRKLIYIVVTVVVVIIIILLFILCCWKMGCPWPRMPSPSGRMLKDGTPKNGQDNAASSPYSHPSTTIHYGTGGGTSTSYYTGSQPSSQDDNTTGFSNATFSTAVGLPLNWSSAAQPVLDETPTELMQSHQLTQFASEAEVNRNAKEKSQMQLTQSHSTQASEFSSQQASHSMVPHLAPLSGRVNGDSGPFLTAYEEISQENILPSSSSHDLAPLPLHGIDRFGGGSNRSRSNHERSENPLQPSPSGIALSFSRVNLFSLKELADATGNFSTANLLGEGGFGSVYKGCLANGVQVAIKPLKPGSLQGGREFQAEVEIISRVHHKHLVSLLGYCITEEQRILVYEFVPNKSLKDNLHGNDMPTMEWSTRVNIALGSAKGLAYLHEDCHPKIIHRDIKSDNILVDHNNEAKIADFGLAKFFPDDNTHIDVTRVMGTFGYLDPECFLTRKFTEKTDVFSFGVVVLELITGREAIIKTESSGVYGLVDWARPIIEARNFSKLVDPRLVGKYDANEMARVIDCAAACVRRPSRSRPRMSQVVRVLEGHLSFNDLNEGETLTCASTFGRNESSFSVI